MFDLALIERMLAKHEYDVDWDMKLVAVGPGREAWESQLAEARQAVAELTKLRRAIEGGHTVRASRNGIVRTTDRRLFPAHARVLLVKLDD